MQIASPCRACDIEACLPPRARRACQMNEKNQGGCPCSSLAGRRHGVCKRSRFSRCVHVVPNAPRPDLDPRSVVDARWPRRRSGRGWSDSGGLPRQLTRARNGARVVGLEPALVQAQRVEPATLGPPLWAAAQRAARADVDGGSIPEPYELVGWCAGIGVICASMPSVRRDACVSCGGRARTVRARACACSVGDGSLHLACAVCVHVMVEGVVHPRSFSVNQVGQSVVCRV